MSHWEIEKNVSINSVQSKKRGPKSKYPFAEMKPGDSVFFEGEKTAGKAYLSAMQWGRRNNAKFSGRAVDGGLRIWRLE